MIPRRPRVPGTGSGGFTLIELLAATLVLSLGVVTGIALVLYGLRLIHTSIGRNTGMPTAMSVAIDPTPIVGLGSNWANAGNNVTGGWLNGYFITRNEIVEAVQPPLPAGITAFTVTVTVSETEGGTVVCSYSQRIMRQTPK